MPITRGMADKLAQAQQELEDARTRRDGVVADAWYAGGGMREIAEVIGLTHSGVSKMLERAGHRKRLTYLELERYRRELDGQRPARPAPE